MWIGPGPPQGSRRTSSAALATLRSALSRQPQAGICFLHPNAREVGAEFKCRQHFEATRDHLGSSQNRVAIESVRDLSVTPLLSATGVLCQA